MTCGRGEAVRELYGPGGCPWHGRDQRHSEEHGPYDDGGGERYLGRTDEEEQYGRQERREDGGLSGTMAT